MIGWLWELLHGDRSQVDTVAGWQDDGMTCCLRDCGTGWARWHADLVTAWQGAQVTFHAGRYDGLSGWPCTGWHGVRLTERRPGYRLTVCRVSAWPGVPDERLPGRNHGCQATGWNGDRVEWQYVTGFRWTRFAGKAVPGWGDADALPGRREEPVTRWHAGSSTVTGWGRTI